MEERTIDGTERRQTFGIAVAAVYAAIYVVLILAFNSISYGQINLRVANVILGLVPIIGWPAIVGQTVGTFLANTVSPLGPVDLVNTIPSFVMSWVVWKLRKVSVFLGLTLYSIGLGLSVSLTLYYAFGLPLAVGIPYVTAGIFIMTAVFGYAFYRAVDKLGVLRRYFK